MNSSQIQILNCSVTSMVAEVDAISISSSTNVTIQDSTLTSADHGISILNATNVSIFSLTILNAEVCAYSI
jgi:hypothetical protein